VFLWVSALALFAAFWLPLLLNSPYFLPYSLENPSKLYMFNIMLVLFVLNFVLFWIFAVFTLTLVYFCARRQDSNLSSGIFAHWFVWLVAIFALSYAGLMLHVFNKISYVYVAVLVFGINVLQYVKCLRQKPQAPQK